LRARALKATSVKEAVRIRDAGYRAQDRARGEADRALWDPMLDVVEELGRQARVVAERAEEQSEKERYEEIGRLRRLEREAAREQWWRYNPGTKTMKKQNPLKSGYAYEYTGRGPWKSSPDDDWEVVMQGGGGGRRVGFRFIDGSRCVVFKKGKKYYAQTAVGSNPRIAPPAKKNPAPGRLRSLNKLTRV
jgi:hypothetical protein